MVHGPHPHPLEVVEAAVGVVDVAWSAFEKHRDHARASSSSSHDQATAWQNCLMLEKLLYEERSENHRLKSALDECHKALQEASQRSRVAELPSSDCPEDLYERLKCKVDSPDFLVKLKELDHRTDERLLTPMGGETPNKAMDSTEYSDSWLIVPNDMFEKNKEESDGLGGDDSYLVLSHDDIVESVATFVANIILANPRAKKMSPSEIQQVISMSFTKLERKGRIQRLWSVGKFVYTSATWTTFILGLYKNPFIMRALMKGLVFTGKLAIKLVV